MFTNTVDKGNDSMSDNVVVSKSNALIQSEYTLSLVAQRVVILAIIEARNQVELEKAKGLLRIKASDYQKTFGCDLRMAYESLKSACDSLYEADFHYWDKDEDGKNRFNKSRFVQKASYVSESAYVEIMFSDDAITNITRLSTQYTEYELNQIKNLNSIYALRIYEMLMQWSSVGKTPAVKLIDLRNRLGIEENQYKQMCDFKKRVLDSAVNEINAHTNINVKYEQIKEGRRISAIIFKFAVKKDAKKVSNNNIRDINTIDMFTNVDKKEQEMKQLTDSQVSYFASLLATDPSFNGFEKGLLANIGESSSDYLFRVKRELSNYNNQKKWFYYLKKLGHK